MFKNTMLVEKLHEVGKKTLVNNFRFCGGGLHRNITRCFLSTLLTILSAVETKRIRDWLVRVCAVLVVLIVAVLFPSACSLVDPTEPEGPPYPPPSFGLDTEPAWSPNGRLIAYVHGDSVPGKTGIYLIEPSGENKRLWYASVRPGTPRWSPDGQWIVFEENEQIYKRKLNGDSLVQLTFEGSNFYTDWSPDGQWIVYDSNVESPNGVYFVCKYVK